MTQKIEVQEYGLFQFLMKVQELFDQGYKMNFERNEDVPMSYGTLFVANMYKAKEVVAEKTVEQPVVEPTAVPDEEVAVKPEEPKAKAGKK